MGAPTLLGSLLLVVVASTSCAGGQSSGPATAARTAPAEDTAATAGVAPPTAAGSTTTTSTASTATSSTSTTTTTTSTTTSTTTTVVPAQATRPIGDVVVAGDSLALGLFAPLQAALQTPERPVGFTWALVVLNDDRLVWERLFTDDRPDVVIVHFSVWENATLRGNEIIDTRDDAWPDVYRREVVDPWIARALESDSHVVWVGSPPTVDPTRWAQHRELDAIWRAAVLEAAEQQRRRGEVPSLEWIDIEDLLSGAEGEFTEVNPTGDPPERWFNTDGMHWCPAGAALVSELVVDALDASFDLGADGPPPIPDWHTAPWANETVAVPSAQGTFGDLQVAYPDGECPPVTAEQPPG